MFPAGILSFSSVSSISPAGILNFPAAILKLPAGIPAPSGGYSALSGGNPVNILKGDRREFQTKNGMIKMINLAWLAI